MQNSFDVIVIGGGAAGAHSAYSLVKAGLSVAMIDGGIESKLNLDQDFKKNFEDIRRERSDQHKLFLGTDFAGIAPKSDEEVHVISMAGGNRKYVSLKTKSYLPIDESGVQVVQTLAKGGLCEVWAALSDVLNKEELEEIGVSSKGMDGNYQEVIDRIGLSGKVAGFKTQAGIVPNNHAKSISSRYGSLNEKQTDGFKIENPLLAISTEPFKGREAFAYKDIEYVANVGNSIYKPRFTIEELEKDLNFTYLPGQIAKSISKNGDSRKVVTKKFNGGGDEYFSKYVVLAAGSLNSTRILLKSFSLENKQVPFITKTHFIIPCLYLKTLGKKDDTKRSSLTQLVIKDFKKSVDLGDRLFAQLFSYKSFLLFRLAKYIPFPAPETLSLLSILTPSFIMLDIRFPSFGEPYEASAYLNDKGAMVIKGKEITTTNQKKRLRDFKKMILKLGLLPLKTVKHPFGSTAHYAGGTPVSKKGDFPLKTNSLGELNLDEKIYVADSATWSGLPAKPPTLTIMANANRVGKNVLKKIKELS